MAREGTTAMAVYSVLASGSRIIGSIYSEEDLRIDGYVEGDIVCKGKVIVGAQSVLKGNIKCSNADISGIVEGNIDTTELLSLKSQCQVKGDMKTATLIIEPGATYNGSCVMSD
jgi:Integral membrane protein CcmA involved in cell shape determination